LSEVSVKDCIFTGLKVITFIASGISAYFGIKGLVNSTSKPNAESIPTNDGNPVNPPPPTPNNSENSDIILGTSPLSQKGQKVIEILSIVSTVCLGVFEVVKSLGAVTNSVDRLLQKKKYTNPSFGGQRGYIPGNYPWNTPERGGYPNNAPIYRGQDNNQDGIYWIQREEGITEVW
jgi:hypothetical protein